MPAMDPLYQAMSCFRRRQFDRCVELTTEILEKNPKDQVRTMTDVLVRFCHAQNIDFA